MTHAIDASVNGEFMYLIDSVEHSLHRNGKVLTRRDPDGSDNIRVGVDLAPYTMSVLNARQLQGTDQPTLAINGFEALSSTLDRTDIDFLDHESVVKRYYPHCTDLVKHATGARVVAAFDHNVRSAAGKQSQQRIRGGQQVQGPAHIVHGDYTLTSAPQRMRDLTHPPGINDTLRAVLADGQSPLEAKDVDQALTNGRFAIINVWRNIADEPVATRPLALCDAATVQPHDLVVFEIHYADRIGENYFAKHNDHHRWYYYPALTHDEALLIKQWDSKGLLAGTNGAKGDAPTDDSPCTFSFHSAFEDPTTPDNAPERWSIEVRCAVLYD